MRALRELSNRVYWFDERKVWRFPFRDRPLGGGSF